MAANMQDIERIANNLANANTVGYRQNRYFTEILEEHIDDEGSPRSIHRTQQWTDQNPGELELTGNPLDVAIDGEGFFTVTDPVTEEARYTRAGQFLLDDQGALRTTDGLYVEGTAGRLDVPLRGGDIEIRRNGEVVVDGESIGTLRIATFENPALLPHHSGATVTAGDQIPEEAQNPVVVQGHLETSNVNAVTSMTELISQSRLFESQTKALRTIDLYLQRATRELSRM